MFLLYLSEIDYGISVFDKFNGAEENADACVSNTCFLNGTNLYGLYASCTKDFLMFLRIVVCFIIYPEVIVKADLAKFPQNMDNIVLIHRVELVKPKRSACKWNYYAFVLSTNGEVGNT